MKITTHKIKIPHTPRPTKPLEDTAQNPLKIPGVQPKIDSPVNPVEQKSIKMATGNTIEPAAQPAILKLPKDPQVSAIPAKTAITEVKKVDVVEKPLTTQQSRSEKKVLVDAKNICKSFYAGHEETKVLKNLSVQIHDEDFLIIVGPSGSGKSTLLHILLGLETPTTGELIFLEKDLYKNTTEDIRSEFRKQHIGMVYQQPNWIKSMTVLENIAFPLILRGYRKELAHEIAFGALQEVHMEMHANQPATELSGGQQQRVSLARCIVHNPEIIVADEPTGNLDYESGQEVMQLLQSLNVKDKKTVIMVTHDIEYIKFANCAVQIFDGQVAGYYGRDNLSDLVTKLHTKHLDQSSLKETYAQNTN
jgi:putative ABC transport system ATP-binding protein